MKKVFLITALTGALLISSGCSSLTDEQKAKILSSAKEKGLAIAEIYIDKLEAEGKLEEADAADLKKLLNSESEAKSE